MTKEQKRPFTLSGQQWEEMLQSAVASYWANRVKRNRIESGDEKSGWKDLDSSGHLRAGGRPAGSAELGSEPIEEHGLRSVE